MKLESNQLSLEQKFIHQVFATKVENLSCEEAKDLLVKFHKQMLFNENWYKELSSDRVRQVTN